MLTKGMGKSEIERELQGKGDYVQIDKIRRFLAENPPLEIKKFLYLKIIEIYENRSMFSQAAEAYSHLTELAADHPERLKHLVKEIEDYIRAGLFDMADLVVGKLLSETRPMEKAGTANSIKEFYRSQAQKYEKEKRRSKAAEVYEKVLTLQNVSDPEKKEIRDKLASLYQQLGLVDKYLQLKNNF